MQRPNFRGHQLTPNTKPLINKQLHYDGNQSNLSSINPLKHPLDISSKARNLSLNDLKPSPGRVQVRSSMMRESTHSETNDYAAKILSKLRERIDELQKQNKSLYDLNVQYELQRNLWEEKAKRLNQQLVRYQDRHLQSRNNSSQIQIRQEIHQQQIKQYQRSLSALQEINKGNEKKILSLISELQRLRIQIKPSDKNSQIQLVFNSLSEDYRQLKQRLQIEQRKNRQSQQEILRLQEQLQFMTKQIPQKINLIELQKIELSNKLTHERTVYESKLAQIKENIMRERYQKESWQGQSGKLKKQIIKVEEDKLKLQRDVQNYNEQVMKLKQANYQQQIKMQQQTLNRQTQINNQKKGLRIQISTLTNENHSLKEAIFQKNTDIQKLQIKVKQLSDDATLSRSTQMELQKNANALVLKNTQSQNLVYKRQIQMLNKTVQGLKKEITDMQASYIKQRNQAHQDIQHLQRHIRDIQSKHQQEKRQLLQSVDIDITDLGNLVKEQENQIANIHQNYCLEINKIVAENTALKKNLQNISGEFIQQRTFLENRLNEQKQYSYVSQTLKMQVQKLTLQIEQQKSGMASLMQSHLTSEENYLLEHQKVNELNIKMREYQNQIEHLHQENEKWRSYRKSEEEDARKECRRFKKRVQELQLKQQESNSILSQIDTFEKKYQQLKLQMVQQQKEYKRTLQEQKVKLSEAINEMETEMRKILRECDSQKISKQQEIIRLREQNSAQFLQISQLAEINRQIKSLQQNNYSSHYEAQMENEILKKQMLSYKSQITRIQNLLKKQESENLSLKYSSDTQKDFIKTRYDKDMQQKVTQIQRLKLQVSHLSEQLKANLVGRKQVQALQIVLKNREMQEREAVQRCKYLQNMIETYLGEIRGLKAMRQKDCTQKRKLQDIVSSFQRKLSQQQTQFNCQATRIARINQQKYRQFQRDSKELKEKNDQANNDIRKLQANLYEATSKQKEMVRLVKQLQNKIAQLTKEFHSQSIKFNRSQQERIRQYQKQISEWKNKCQQLHTQNNRLKSKWNELALQQTFLQKQLREQEVKINEANQTIKKSKFQAQETKQKYSILQERLNTTTKDILILTETKQKYLELEQKQIANRSTIEDQRQKIENISKDQAQKRREIQILLSKINLLEADLSKASKIAPQIHIDVTKSKRIECYLSICNLNLLGNNTCKLSYEGDEQLFLRILVDTLKTLNSKLIQCLNQLGSKKKMILQLTEQKQNLNNKYLKYKAFALQYKQKKEMQKYVLKNTYRFNQEIINHCQDIIKNDRK